jgi:hypothetical protein
LVIGQNQKDKKNNAIFYLSERDQSSTMNAVYSISIVGGRNILIQQDEDHSSTKEEIENGKSSLISNQ